MIKIKATFAGEYTDHAPVYIPGTEYELAITAHANGKVIITIYGKPQGYCPYESFIAFLTYWTEIKTQNI